ncbi:MAG TPA: hypothetical protein PLP69_08180 [Bacteroidales bacterium]|nr:hypothetical protein [Bacteroidales bacterium]
MIQADILNSIAVGVVGWEQPTVTGSPVIDVDNIASSSGLYYQHGSGLCTVQNIKDTVEDASISDDNLNTVLSNFSKSALNRICAQIFDENDHIDTGLLYKYENKWSELLANDTSFVGFEIDLSKRNDLTLVINSLILEFDSVTTKKILLFNSQQNAAIKSKSITTVAKTAKYEGVDWKLNDLQYGGKWYIGYLRSASDVPMAVKRNFQMSNYQTEFCDVDIRPIKINGWTSETMFDPSTIIYESDTWGLNFDLSLFQDYTYIVKSNVNRFAPALQLQVCSQVIDMISNTTRSNRNERLSKAYALMELNGNKNNPNLPFSVGLNTRLGKEIKRLKDTFNPRGIIRMTL